MIGEWMARRQAAAYLGVSVTTLDRYIKEGKLTKHNVGGTRTVRLARAEVEALMTPGKTARDAA